MSAQGNARMLLLGTDTAGTIAGVTTGTSVWVDAGGYNHIAVFLSSIGTTSGGTVLIEEADWDVRQDAPYGDTAAIIATVAASTFSGTATVTSKSGPSCFGFVRVRISSAITGGGSMFASIRLS